MRLSKGVFHATPLGLPAGTLAQWFAEIVKLGSRHKCTACLLRGCCVLRAQLKVPDAVSDTDAAQFLSAAPHAHALMLQPC